MRAIVDARSARPAHRERQRPDPGRNDCPEDAAAGAGVAVREWLIEHGIVDRELTDCVLGGDGRGHPPGPNVEAAVEGEADATRELWTNGLAIVVGEPSSTAARAPSNFAVRGAAPRSDPRASGSKRSTPGLSATMTRATGSVLRRRAVSSRVGRTVAVGPRLPRARVLELASSQTSVAAATAGPVLRAATPTG